MKKLRRFCLLCITIFVAANCCAQQSSRTLNISDHVPSFRAVQSNGSEFDYIPEKNQVLIVLFFSPAKPQSAEAMEDLRKIITSVNDWPHKLVCVAVSDDPNSTNMIKDCNTEKLSVYFIKDTDFQLWGKFGVIASPTVFISGLDGKVEFIKAGYGYDFAPAIKAKLHEIMGLEANTSFSPAGTVKTITNDSAAQKADRHLKMAQMLENRGDYKAAMEQLKTAVQIDPNEVEHLLELATLYCRVSDPNKAIGIAQDLRPSGNSLRARRALILGEAYSQLSDSKSAQKFLLEAIELDPKNSRALYELGKICESENNRECAIDSYRKSLDIIYQTRK